MASTASVAFQTVPGEIEPFVHGSTASNESDDAEVGLEGSVAGRRPGGGGVLVRKALVASLCFAALVACCGLLRRRLSAAPTSSLSTSLRRSERLDWSLESQIMQKDSLPATRQRLPARACFESRAQYEPLNMQGQSRHGAKTVEECQTKCRSVTGCAHISYWQDGGCHLADKDAEQVDAREKATDAMAGPPSCQQETVCFSYGVQYEPINMVGRGRVTKNSASECHAYCKGMSGCKYFSWWPDGGCHVQGQSAKAIAADDNVIAGPAVCPLAPGGVSTSTSTAATTSTQTTASPTTSTSSPSPSTTSPVTTTEQTESTTTAPATTTTAPATTTTAPATTTTAPTTTTVQESEASTTTREEVVVSTSEAATTTTAAEAVVTTSTSLIEETTVTDPATTTSAVEVTTTANQSTMYGCKLGRPLLFTSHRQQHMIVSNGAPKLASSEETKVYWVLSDAGDGRVFLTGHGDNQLLDDSGSLKLGPLKSEQAKWTLADAGGGKVFVRGHHDERLQDFSGELKMTTEADAWEKWTVTTVGGSSACEFSSLSLFCITVMRSWGDEPDILRQQNRNSAGIFGCDEQLIISDKEIDLSSGSRQRRTIALSNDVLSHAAGASRNAHFFLEVWEAVKSDGRHRENDWTAKVDPDAVFIPDRLRERLGGASHARVHRTFFANCAGRIDVQAEEHPHFMYGPLEVFSQAAMNTLLAGMDRCKTDVGLGKNMFEERYITHCLELLGVKMNPYLGLHLLQDPHCDNTDAVPDCTSDAVSFHNFSTPQAYMRCWRTAHKSHMDMIDVKK